MIEAGAEARNLAASLDVNAKARPDHPAIIAGDDEWSHAEVSAEVRRLASYLSSKGVVAGDVIGVAIRDSPDHLMMNFAVVRLGAVLLPLDWRWSAEEITRVALHFRAKVVICEPGANPLPDVATVTMDNLRSGPEPDTEPAMALEQDMPLLMSLSSGTTGMPSGPELTHPQMLRRFWIHWINLGLNADDRYLSATPLYFGGGRTFAMSVLFAGGTVILFPPPFHALEVCTEISRTKATSLFLVPTQLRGLLDLDDERLAPLRGLELLISSGAPLDPDERLQIDKRLNGNFREYYASTEGGGVSLSTRKSREKSPDSVGQPVFGVEIEIVDQDDAPLAPNTVGRLRYRGPGVATKAFSRDGKQEQVLTNGWFYPGDLAEMDESGFVTLRGRAKEMIIRGGVNIYPVEVETTLRSHPGISDAAVLGLPDKRLGEVVVAACVASDLSINDAIARAWCAERLASYKLPTRILFMDALPRNTAGKVRKADLVSLFQLSSDSDPH